MIAVDLLVALVAVLRPADGGRLLAHVEGPDAAAAARAAAAHLARTRAERATALVRLLRERADLDAPDERAPELARLVSGLDAWRRRRAAPPDGC